MVCDECGGYVKVTVSHQGEWLCMDCKDYQDQKTNKMVADNCGICHFDFYRPERECTPPICGNCNDGIIREFMSAQTFINRYVGSNYPTGDKSRQIRLAQNYIKAEHGLEDTIGTTKVIQAISIANEKTVFEVMEALARMQLQQEATDVFVNYQQEQAWACYQAMKRDAEMKLEGGASNYGISNYRTEVGLIVHSGQDPLSGLPF